MLAFILMGFRRRVVSVVSRWDCGAQGRGVSYWPHGRPLQS